MLVITIEKLPVFPSAPLLVSLVMCLQLWVQERLPAAASQEHGSSLQAVQHLMKKNQVSGS